jgi:hypothetical protein
MQRAEGEGGKVGERERRVGTTAVTESNRDRHD